MQGSTTKVLFEMKLAHKTVVIIVVCACLLSPIGCGSSDDARLPGRDAVSGTVTLDGKKVDGGSITFFSEKDVAAGIQASASIKDGRYEILVTPGLKKVKINQTVETRPNVFEDLIPAKYNSKTTLEADVSQENKQFDYELLSK